MLRALALGLAELTTPLPAEQHLEALAAPVGRPVGAIQPAKAQPAALWPAAPQPATLRRAAPLPAALARPVMQRPAEASPEALQLAASRLAAQAVVEPVP